MESTKLTIRQLETDIEQAVLKELEHAGNFLLIQDEDIELINKRLEILAPNK